MQLLPEKELLYEGLVQRQVSLGRALQRAPVIIKRRIQDEY